MPKPIDGLWRLGAIEVKRHNNHDKTSQLYPGIVCVESGHCATIHWGLSNGLVIWLAHFVKLQLQRARVAPFVFVARVREHH